MSEKLLRHIMFRARRPDGYWSRAKIVWAIKQAYKYGSRARAK